jgi:PAS domain S-box-containing protein
MASSGPSEELGVSTGELDSVVQDTEFFRSLVENGSDAIVSIDEHSTILYANESVERVFGYRPEELIGEKLTTIMPDRFHRNHLDAIGRYIETGERTLNWNDIELPAEHRSGEEIPLSITFEEHSYEGERVFSGIMRDISDRVQREEELERQNERLERFASIVSHDIREPLQTARATLAVARAGDESALDELDDVFDRMDALVGDVLTLAKEGETVGETDPVDLEGVVRDAWGTTDAGDASLAVDDDLPTVAADRERLRTLLENLFRNSVEHGSTGNRTESGDSVEHGSTGSRPETDDSEGSENPRADGDAVDSVEHGSTGNRPKAGDSVEHGSTGSRPEADDSEGSENPRADGDAVDSVEHGSTGSRPEADDSVEHGSPVGGVTIRVETLDDDPGFVVADDGPGFGDADTERLFEYGYTTSESGTGFGLSIVDEVARAHGWIMTATTGEDGGARFEVRTR